LRRSLHKDLINVLPFTAGKRNQYNNVFYILPVINCKKCK